MIKIEPMVASFCPKCKIGWYYPIDMPDDEKNKYVDTKVAMEKSYTQKC